MSVEKLEKLYDSNCLKLPPIGQEQQRQVKEVIWKYSFLFAMDSLDLGQTDLVKHHTELTDYTPIKDRYQHIAQHQYNKV